MPITGKSANKAFSMQRNLPSDGATVKIIPQKIMNKQQLEANFQISIDFYIELCKKYCQLVLFCNKTGKDFHITPSTL